MSVSSKNIAMVDLKSQYLRLKPEIDQAIADVLNAMPRYARVLRVNEPYQMQTNNAEYLSVNVSVELEITI